MDLSPIALKHKLSLWPVVFSRSHRQAGTRQRKFEFGDPTLNQELNKKFVFTV